MDTASRVSRERHNFVVLVLYQVVLRIGWIFKTESVIMPAVLDSLGGPGWLRGCLPMLNRFGQSATPLLIARRVKVTRRKKWAQALSSGLMSLAFLFLFAVWTVAGDDGARWLAAAFLATYAVFFMATGANQLCLSTLQGKLIHATSRGRLMLAANVFGSTCAVVAAMTLMPLWLSPGGADFRWLFAISASGFGVAAIVAAMLREPPDDYQQPHSPVSHKLREALRTLANDPNFRRLALVAVLFDASVMLFPHYQALARSERVQLDMTNLVYWVVVQNVGTGSFSLLAGPLADRFGNRFVLRLLVFGIGCAPLLAVGLSHSGSFATKSYIAVFALIGSTPVVVRTLQNYTLEISETPDHPRYLSTLSLCLMLPIFLSPIIGKLIDAVGFDLVFVLISGFVFLGWLTTFRLAEPRHALAVVGDADSETLTEVE